VIPNTSSPGTPLEGRGPSGRAGAASAATLLGEISGGLIAACLTLPLCVGAGILAFSPLGPGYVAHGAMAGLQCAVIGGAVAALVRRSSFVVTFPTTPICAIQAGIALSVFNLCGDWRLFALAMALCLALAGLWQAVFAVSGVSRVMRFVPHPVMAGFVTGVAGFIAWHQLPALVGVGTVSDVLRPGFRLAHPQAAAFGVGVLVLMLLIPRVAPRIPSLLGGLVIGTLVFHAAGRAFRGADLGTTIGALPSTSFWALPHLDSETFRALLGRPEVFTTVLIGSLTLALVATLDTFFALRTAQFIASVKVDPRRDVLGQGMANVATALTGGLAVSTSLSVSMANHHAGGRTRISTLASAGTLLLGVALAPQLIALLPRVVIAAVLVAVSIRLTDRWSFVVLREALAAKEPSRRRRALRDALVVLAVFFATVVGKPVMGVGVGIGLAGVLFVLDMSRPVVARRRSGTLLRSKRLRPAGDLAALKELGSRLRVFDLQGDLFFGNAEALAADLEEPGEDAEFVILDCRRLREIDTSGLAVLDKTAARYRKEGRTLLVAAPSAEWAERTFTAAGSRPDYVHPSLDAALEWAEDLMLARSRAGRDPAEPPEQMLESSAAIRQSLGTRLEGKLPLATFAAGSFLCRAGDLSDRMWVLKRGSVKVQSHRDPRILFARLGPGSTVGEMGFMERAPRSADVLAQQDVEAYILTWDDLHTLLAKDSVTGLAILLSVAGQLASRLRRTTAELGDSEHSG
jgi:SulP family sulfate permease